MLNFAIQTARDAGRLLAESFGRNLRVSNKSELDLVTDSDLASERLIIDRIKTHYPRHTVLAEESGTNPPATDGEQSDWRWIIDPLDGTTNYAHGYPCFCISIGLEHGGTLEVGVVYDPMRDECFAAERGEFARHFANFIMNAQGVRRDGAAALDLAYVAAGRFDGFWEEGLKPWDVAASVLLIEEAGGRVSDYHGGAFDIFTPPILASNGLIHDQMMRVLAA